MLAILAFEALGALIGGPALMAGPDGRFMNIPIEELHGTFSSFLIPGLLLTFLGVLNAVAFVAVLQRAPSAWLWAGLALCGFFIWFVVELSITGLQSWAQVAWGLPVPFGVLLALPLLRRAVPVPHP